MLQMLAAELVSSGSAATAANRVREMSPISAGRLPGAVRTRSKIHGAFQRPRVGMGVATVQAKKLAADRKKRKGNGCGYMASIGSLQKSGQKKIKIGCCAFFHRALCWRWNIDPWDILIRNVRQRSR